MNINVLLVMNSVSTFFYVRVTSHFIDTESSIFQYIGPLMLELIFRAQFIII